MNLLSRFGEDKRFGAVCYLLPFVVYTVLLSSRWVVLPFGLVFLVIIALLAPKASSLKFHAVQATFFSLAFLIGFGIIYVFTLYGVTPQSGFVGVLFHIGASVVLLMGMFLAYLILTGILFLKTWRGKTIRLPLLSEWATAVNEGDYTVLKWIIVCLGIAAVMEFSYK